MLNRGQDSTVVWLRIRVGTGSYFSMSQCKLDDLNEDTVRVENSTELRDSHRLH